MFPAATAWLFALAHLRVRVSELLPGFLESSEPNVTGCVPQRAWPTMARLARTRLLNVSRMHADDRRVCPGDRPSILDVADAPGSLCVYRADVPDGFDWLFDMYRHERVMLGRWLERVRTCGPWAAPAAPGAAPRLAAPCEADVVVVASPQLHHHAQHGSTWRWTKCLGSAALARFWREIRAAYFDGWQRPPVVVVNEPYAFDVRANVHLLRELASQPAAFTSRVVVTTSMSSQTLAVRAHFPRSWMDGGEVELRRRECLAARKGPAAARAGGPLLVTLPRTTGVSRAPDWAAPAPGPESVGLRARLRAGHRRALQRHPRPPRAVRQQGDAVRPGPHAPGPRGRRRRVQQAHRLPHLRPRPPVRARDTPGAGLQGRRPGAPVPPAPRRRARPVTLLRGGPRRLRARPHRGRPPGV